MRTSPSRGRSEPPASSKNGGAVKRIALIEDDADIAYTIRLNLRKEKRYQVEHYVSGLAALGALQEKPFDLVILDLNLPDIDGLALCRELRRADETRRVPIIMLTARVEEADRLRGLEIGADDYITKPFSPRELVARVQALLRRARPVSARGPNAMIRSGDIEIDPRSRTVRVESRPVQLTAKEFDLLHFLASHPNHVFTRDELMNRVWDFEFAGDTGTVTVHVRRLRQKIEPDPDRPRYLKTVWGVGYKFEPAQA